jgi:hypothetical protein
VEAGYDRGGDGTAMIHGGIEEESSVHQFESSEGGTGARCGGGALAVGGGRRLRVGQLGRKAMLGQERKEGAVGRDGPKGRVDWALWWASR